MLVIGMFGAWALGAAAQPYVTAEPPRAHEPKGAIGTVLLSPVFREPFMCGEHPAGENSVVGDELGTDCQILGGVLDEHRDFARLYRTDGRHNEDWYSWGADVLAPCDCDVVAVHANTQVNQPGTMGRPPAGFIIFRRPDGVNILYAHTADFTVRMGDHVKAGQVVGKVGNNGPSYAPHIHIGAYKDLVPLQIRWDQRAIARYQDEILRQRKAGK
jgi:murein DD-endopeptidase MepM/ murein hydrolase activator NlpD